MKSIFTSLVFLLVAATNFAYGQTTNRITGTVTDDRGKSLIGATVLVKGSTLGVITGADGTFVLTVRQELPVTIEASLIGYDSQEIDVYELGEPIEVSLTDNTNYLSEVVVVGYGTQKRKELTGAITSVSSSILEHPTTSLDGMLGGAVAGMNVTQTSGQPGASSSIRIRGGNSVYASNEPLYVIDGFIFFSEKNATQTGIGGIDGSLNPLASINPADIESIEVLKDVSAKAIYGTRGANGVILVTTKKGKRGGNTIHYQYSLGVDKSAKKLDLMTAQEWAQVQNDYFNSNYYSAEEIAQLGTGTNWQDAVLRTGVTQNHELSISGGDDKTRYLISGSYTDQKGIVLNSGFERYSGRLNLDRQLFSNLTVGVTATADKSTQNALTTFEEGNVDIKNSPFSRGISNSLTYALYMPPVVPIKNPDGSYNYDNPFEYGYFKYYGQAANPVSDLENSIGQTVSTSLLGNFYAQYTIVEGLVAKINAGANVNYITQNFFAPPTSALGFNQEIRGIGAIGNRRTGITQSEYLLTYSKQLNPIHYIDLLAGYTNQNTETNFVVSNANHLESLDNLALGKAKPSISRTQTGYLYSVLARANYTLMERYNLTATYRADKSSRFAAGYEWNMFPSVGLSWNISDEEFAKPIAPAVSTLKLRLTYGEAGNQEIGFDDYKRYFDGATYGDETALSMTNLGNANLKWETTTEYNAGIDAGFLRDKLTLVADVYYKETRDLLIKVPTSDGSGTLEKQLVNLGNVTNKGFEVALSAKLIENRKLNWSAAANFARNVNEITSIGKYDVLYEGDNQEQIFRVGESVGSFYGYVFNGVVQTGEDVSTLPQKSGVSKPGDAKFADISGVGGTPDGKIDATNDRVVIGSIQPDFTYGLSTTLTYANFDFYVSLQGSKGNKVYNLLRQFLEGRPGNAYNMSAALLNAWTEDNPSNTIPRIQRNYSNELDSRFVEDASFLKIRNITLGYTLPVKVRALPMKFRVFASAQNLYTFTKYEGYDPEVASGIDLGIYPSSRNFTAGLSVTF